MEFLIRLEETADGEVIASCASPEVRVRGLTPANALDRLRAELRYQVELCPCSGVEEDEIVLRTGGRS